MIALATLLGLPGMYVWSSVLAQTSVPKLVWGPVTFALIGMTVVGSFVLYRFVQGRADMPGRGLDERQQHLRDQAWILSYEILAGAVILAVVVTAIEVLGFGHAIALDGNLMGAAAISVGVLIPILPVAALAAIEPDPPADL